MSGEALTTGGLLTRDFPSELLEIHLEDVHLLAGESHQEVGPVKAGDGCGPLLRDQPLRVPADCRCQAHLFLNLSRGAAQSLINLIRELDGQCGHTHRSYTFSAERRPPRDARPYAPSSPSSVSILSH